MKPSGIVGRRHQELIWIRGRFVQESVMKRANQFHTVKESNRDKTRFLFCTFQSIIGEDNEYKKTLILISSISPTRNTCNSFLILNSLILYVASLPTLCFSPTCRKVDGTRIASYGYSSINQKYFLPFPPVRKAREGKSFGCNFMRHRTKKSTKRN